MTLFSVEGKVVVVTGGSRGIGRMIAQVFADAGATVYLTARKKDQLDEAAAALGLCRSVQADLLDPRRASRPCTTWSPPATTRWTCWSTTPAPPGRLARRLSLSRPSTSSGTSTSRASSSLTQRFLPLLRKSATPTTRHGSSTSARSTASGPRPWRTTPTRRRSRRSTCRSPAPRRPARQGVDHRQRHRARPVRLQDDVVRPRRPAGSADGRVTASRWAGSAASTTVAGTAIFLASQSRVAT